MSEYLYYMHTNQKKRLNKIYKEDFFLLDVKKDGDKYVFHISGSTANVYTIQIKPNIKNMSCDCPDANGWAKKQGCLCKHCCFLLVRVLKFSESELENDILLDSDHKFGTKVLKETITKSDKMIKSGMYLKEDFVNQKYIDRFKNLKSDKGKKKTDYEVHKELTEEDECIICFDTLAGQKDENMVACPVCNNVLHKKCMEKWIDNGNKNCVYCRSKVWEKYGKENSVTKGDKYANLEL